MTTISFISQVSFYLISFLVKQVEYYSSQIGGLMGLCLGFSLLSFIELIYWCTYRTAKNTIEMRKSVD